MAACGRSLALLRLCTTVVLLGYLLAGASLILPAEPRCTRCARAGMTTAMKPGTFCPLSHHGHDYHKGQGTTIGSITLCPDGCLRHNGQGGEIPSPVKFLSALSAFFLSPAPTGLIAEETLRVLLDLSFPPPDPPPPWHS